LMERKKIQDGHMKAIGKARIGRRRQRRGSLTLSYQPSTIKDLIHAAWARECEAGRLAWPPMEETNAERGVFRCVCCGKTRGDEQRREPDSEVCRSCERAAGFLN
jgi:hypothetical protein